MQYKITVYKVWMIEILLAFKMEIQSNLHTLIKRAIVEVERNPSLPNNSLINHHRVDERIMPIQVNLQTNLLADVPDHLNRHSRERPLMKWVAEQEQLIQTFYEIFKSAIEN